MFELVREWYRSKVNALKTQNLGFRQLERAVQEADEAEPETGWSKIVDGIRRTAPGSQDVIEASQIVNDQDNRIWYQTSRRPEYKGHIPGDQEAMIAQARRYFRTDPNGRAALWTMVKYIIGPGLKITPQSKDPRVHRLWREFWNADRNKMRLRQFELVLRTMRDGETFIQYFNTDENGQPTWKTTIRFRDPLLLKEGLVPYGENPVTGKADYRMNSRLGVEVNPDDPETVLAYHIADPWDLAKVQRIPAEQIQHIKIFADLDQKRGESFLQPIMEMLEHYRQWMKYRIMLNKVRTAVVMVRKITGGTQADISRMSQNLAASATNRQGESKKISFREGTILNANAGVDYDFKSPNINASDVSEDGRRMKLEMAAGTGQPEHAFGDASNSNMASTLIAESPFVKDIKFWETFFEFHLKDMFRRVVQAAVKAGKLQEPPEDDIFGEETVSEAADKPSDLELAVTAGAQVRPDAEDGKDAKVGTDDDVDDDGDAEDDLTQLSEHEAFYGCDIQWPEIVHREIDKTTAAVIQQKDAGLISDATAASVLGYDYDEEVRRQQQIEKEAEDNPFKQQAAQDRADAQAAAAADVQAQGEEDAVKPPAKKPAKTTADA